MGLDLKAGDTIDYTVLVKRAKRGRVTDADAYSVRVKFDDGSFDYLSQGNVDIALVQRAHPKVGTLMSPSEIMAIRDWRAGTVLVYDHGSSCPIVRTLTTSGTWASSGTGRPLAAGEFTYSYTLVYDPAAK